MRSFPSLDAASNRRTTAAFVVAGAAAVSLFVSITDTSRIMEGFLSVDLYYNSSNYFMHDAETLRRNIRQNKTLVIAMGELRGGEAAWRTLYEKVLDPNIADLALMTTNNNTLLALYPNNTLMQRAKYIWRYEQYDDWADAVDLVDGRGWRTTHLPQFRDWNEIAYWGKNRSILFGGIEGHDGSGIIIFMMRYFLLQHIKASGILDLYDTFVVTRTDHYYMCPHMFTACDLGGNAIWVPEGEEYGGYTDRHLVVSKENLLAALDIITPLITKPYTFDYEKHHNTERFVKSVWEDRNLTVRKCLRSMLTVATRFDTTRWKAPGEEELEDAPGLFVKYRNEHLRAKSGCLQFHHNLNHSFIPGGPKYTLQSKGNIHDDIERRKGPFLFEWNGTTHEEGTAFCQSSAGSRSICPYKAYCLSGSPLSGIERGGDDTKLWSPLGSEGQPVWVNVGTVHPCMRQGILPDETKVKYILCCREGEEKGIETMPDVPFTPELCAAPTATE